MGYAEVIKADSPLFAFALDDVGTSTARDASGNGRNGTYNGGYTLGAQVGPFVGCQLNGSTGYISVPYGSWKGSGDTGSWEAWLIPRIVGAGTHGAIITWSLGAPYMRTGVSPYTVDVLRSQTAGLGTTNASLSTMGAHHVVWTRSGTGTDKVYIDGVADTATFIGATMAANTAPVCIGCENASTTGIGALSEFGGHSLAWVAAYGSALTAAQVAAHHAAGLRNAVSY